MKTDFNMRTSFSGRKLLPAVSVWVCRKNSKLCHNCSSEVACGWICGCSALLQMRLFLQKHTFRSMKSKQYSKRTSIHNNTLRICNFKTETWKFLSVYPHILLCSKWKPQAGGELPFAWTISSKATEQFSHANEGFKLSQACHREREKKKKWKCPLDLQEGYYKPVICLLLNQAFSVEEISYPGKRD